MRDHLRFAIRSLRKSPIFTISALLTLGIGIGGSTAMFTVVDAVLLRKAPFPAAERIVVVTGTNRRAQADELAISYPNFVDLREQNRVFERVGAWTSYRDTKLALTGDDEPEEVQYALATADFFGVFGVRPAHGRLFRPEEDEPGTAPVAVISHGLWERRFGSEDDVIGRTMVLDGIGHTVVGVLPHEFRFATFPEDAAVWLPFGLDPVQGRRFSRGTNYIGIVARLMPRVELTQATDDVQRVASELERAYPHENQGDGLRLTPVHAMATSHLREAVLVLFVAVGLVLLISCANVANLQLARLPSRQRELAVHVALGAPRGRMVVRLAFESLLLAIAGGALGLLLAMWIADLVLLLPSTPASPFVPYRLGPNDLAIDARMVTFALASSVIAAVLFGTVPALRASAVDLASMLRGRSGSVGARSGRLKDALVVAEVALALVLLVGAGLLASSYLRLRGADPGFHPENVIAADVNLSRAKYAEPDRMAAFHRTLSERLRAAPGVEAAGAIDLLPLSGADQSSDFYIDGIEWAPSADRPHVHNRTVVPGYFEAMGIDVVRGRTLTDRDRSAARRVVVINESFARHYLAGVDPIGRRIGLGLEAFVRFDPVAMRAVWDSAGALREVVGVVRDVRSGGVAVPANPELYLPYGQAATREMTVVMRTTAEAGEASRQLRQVVAELDPDQPVSNSRPMEAVQMHATSKSRIESALLSAFAAVALLLAAIGVFGIAAHDVAQRTHEIGIRVALGGTPRNVAGLILGRAARLAILGIAIGLVAALWSTQTLSTLLFGIGPHDPIMFGGAAMLGLLVAILASWLPARRAARVQPMAVLRQL